jgi:hypothetical protein
MALRESSVLHTKTSENMTKCESSTFTISNSQMSQYDVHVHKCQEFQGTLPLHLLLDWSPQWQILFKSTKVLRSKDL